MHLARRLVVNVPRNVLSRGIERVERREVVEILVIERPNHSLNHLLQMHEIVKQPRGIDLFSRQRDADPVIMTMLIFALSFVSTQVMPCRKTLVYADFVHGSPGDPSGPMPRIAVNCSETPPAHSASAKRATSARSCVTVYSGSDSRKILPYCMRCIRLSRIASTPRSLRERISRPNPCLSDKTAFGT